MRTPKVGDVYISNDRQWLSKLTVKDIKNGEITFEECPKSHEQLDSATINLNKYWKLANSSVIRQRLKIT